MKRTQDIDNGQDIIDSRDVIARIEELVGEIEGTCDACEGIGEIESTSDDPEASRENIKCTTCGGSGTVVDEESDEYAELKILQNLVEQGEGYGDWAHGETLIRDSYFQKYAEQLSDDLGMLKDGQGWPYTCIDWEKAAEELQQDYTSVEFDGVTYWMRS